nr:fatty acid desaturase [Bordetella parapertussis]
MAGAVGRTAGARPGQGLLAGDRAAAAWPALAAGHQLPAARPRRRGPGRHAALSYARNFEGWVNPLLFNIGLHTAHHENPRAHWSELRALHWQHYRDRVPSHLNERGLARYMARVFVLGLFSRRCRTHTLMRP